MERINPMNEISERLHIKLDSLSKEVLKNLLIEALSVMEHYNGQSITSAICRAMGAEEIEDERGIRWEIPTNKEIEEMHS